MIMINKTFIFHIHLGEREKVSLPFQVLVLPEEFPLTLQSWIEFLIREGFYSEFIRTPFEESAHRVSLCEQLRWCTARLPL